MPNKKVSLDTFEMVYKKKFRHINGVLSILIQVFVYQSQMMNQLLQGTDVI